MNKKENLDLYYEGYEDEQIFSFDMRIWMTWYVKRLKEIVKSPSAPAPM